MPANLGQKGCEQLFVFCVLLVCSVIFVMITIENRWALKWVLITTFTLPQKRNEISKSIIWSEQISKLTIVKSKDKQI